MPRTLADLLDAASDAIIAALLGERILQTIPNEDGRFVVVSSNHSTTAVLGIGPVDPDTPDSDADKHLVTLDERNRRILAAGLLAGLPTQDWQVTDEVRTAKGDPSSTRMVTSVKTQSGRHEIALISDFGDKAGDPARPWVWMLADPAKASGASPTRDLALMAVAHAINIGPAA